MLPGFAALVFLILSRRTFAFFREVDSRFHAKPARDLYASWPNRLSSDTFTKRPSGQPMCDWN